MSMYQFKGLLINITYSEAQEIWDRIQVYMHQF